MSRYKFLKYCQQPNSIPLSIFDLVDARTFIKPDGRIPVLISLQCSVFPGKGSYSTREISDYGSLLVLKHQVVAFVRRSFFTGNEWNYLEEFFLDDTAIEMLTK
jgi:hypothetical protein